MRLFVAIDCKEIEDYLNKIQKEFQQSGLRLTKTYHLTLEFLGEVEDQKKVIDSLSEVKLEKFEIEMSGLGVFPNKNYVRVFWLGIKENKKLNQLQANIHEKLSYLNIKQKHKFHPHITLARVSFLKDKEKFIDKLENMKIEKKKVSVNNFVLYSSNLTPKGPIYDVVKIFD